MEGVQRRGFVRFDKKMPKWQYLKKIYVLASDYMFVCMVSPKLPDGCFSNLVHGQNLCCRCATSCFCSIWQNIVKMTVFLKCFKFANLSLWLYVCVHCISKTTLWMFFKFNIRKEPIWKVCNIVVLFDLTKKIKTSLFKKYTCWHLITCLCAWYLQNYPTDVFQI